MKNINLKDYGLGMFENNEMRNTKNKFSTVVLAVCTVVAAVIIADAAIDAYEGFIAGWNSVK